MSILFAEESRKLLVRTALASWGGTGCRLLADGLALLEKAKKSIQRTHIFAVIFADLVIPLI
jgi:hypothetical protein